MDNRPVGVTLDSLNKRPKVECRRVVQDLVKTIDELILVAHSNQKGKVQYDLDKQYEIASMNPEDATLYVYSELVDTYRKKGFSPLIVRTATRLVFEVRWETRLSVEDREKRRKLVESAEIGIGAGRQRY
jgi:hypothetical protein